MSNSLFTPLNYQDTLPLAFNYPYVGQVEDVLASAVKHCQQKLMTDTPLQTGHKMGVLVVKSQQGQLGYLVATEQNERQRIDGVNVVPSLLNQEADEYRQGVKCYQFLTEKWQAFEVDESVNLVDEMITTQRRTLQQQLAAVKTTQQLAKQERQEYRRHGACFDQESKLLLSQALAKQSIAFKYFINQWQQEHDEQHQQLDLFHEAASAPLKHLKHYIDNLHALQQHRLLKSTVIFNAKRDHCQLNELVDTKAIDLLIKQPSPALLNYAFQQGLTPVAMTEFWWGKDAGETVHHHGHCYPSNQTQCKPLFDFMLQGLSVAPNPLFFKVSKAKKIEVIYQDNAIVVINKPPHLLSVKGLEIHDSVQQRMAMLFPQAEGDMIVHRLDMETSGVMVLALTRQAHKNLQRQFVERTIGKRYIALLEGHIDAEQGQIDLPIRPDITDRPRQRICERYGKPALTEWHVVSRQDSHTVVAFYPKTGRSHQLRVHAAHWRGLNRPIVGDSLYGKPSSRLFLHADQLIFRHPITGEKLVFEVESYF